MAAPTVKVGRGSGSSVYRSQGEGIYPIFGFLGSRVAEPWFWAPGAQPRIGPGLRDGIGSARASAQLAKYQIQTAFRCEAFQAIREPRPTNMWPPQPSERVCKTTR
jgi:hypothetical protein